jgi:hypothetical protein
VNRAAHQAAQIRRQQVPRSRGAGANDGGHAVVYAEAAVGSGKAYNATVRLLANSLAEADASLEDFRLLAKYLRQAYETELERYQVAAVLETRTPFAPLARMLPKSRSEYYDFISMLAAVVGLIIAAVLAADPAEEKPTITPQQVEEIVDRVIEHMPQPAPPTAVPEPSAPATHPRSASSARPKKAPVPRPRPADPH